MQAITPSRPRSVTSRNTWWQFDSGLALLQSTPGWNGTSRVGWPDVSHPQMEYPEMEGLIARANAIKQPCRWSHKMSSRWCGVRQSSWCQHQRTCYHMPSSLVNNVTSGSIWRRSSRPSETDRAFYINTKVLCTFGGGCIKGYIYPEGIGPTSSFQGSEVVTLEQ